MPDNLGDGSVIRPVIYLSPLQLSQIASLRNQGRYPEAYSYVHTALSAISGVDQETTFWFEQAARINSGSGAVSNFIRNFTRNGLAVSGKTIPDMKGVSDAIALAVLTEIELHGGVPALPIILANDINQVTQRFGVSVAGWGGSFYYWDLPAYNPQAGGYSVVSVNGKPDYVTIGEIIESDPRERRRFTIALGRTLGQLANPGDIADALWHLPSFLDALNKIHNLPVDIQNAALIEARKYPGFDIVWGTFILMGGSNHSVWSLSSNSLGFEAENGHLEIEAVIENLRSYLATTLIQEPPKAALSDVLNAGLDALQVIDGGQLGFALGSVLGRRIVSDPFAEILVSGTLGSLLGTVGEHIDENLFDGANSTWDLVKEGEASLGASLLTNIKGAGAGALSSYLTAQLFDAAGIDGFEGELAETFVGGYLTAILNNLDGLLLPVGAPGHVNMSDILSGVNPATIVGSFIGTKLAKEIYSPDTVGGQIGGAIGGAAGGFQAVIALATLAKRAKQTAIAFSLAHPVTAVAVVAAMVLVDVLVGSLIGSIFGGTPRSGADVAWNSASGAFSVSNSYARKGGSKEAAIQISQTVADSFNAVLHATGSSLVDPSAVQSGNYGLRKKDYVYRPTHTRDKEEITARFSSSDQLIGHGVYLGLEDMVNQLAGGSIYAKRAVSGSLKNVNGDANSFRFETLLGDMTVAQDYASFLHNSVAVRALIAANSQSSFAAGWMVTLARAVELGLHRRNATDWIGGFNLWMDEVVDGAIDGLSSSPALFTAGVDPLSKARYWSVGDTAGDHFGFVEDSIEASSQDEITGTAGADIIQLGGTQIANATSTINYGLTLNGETYNGVARTIEVAAYVDAGDGNDYVYASDRGDTVLGGAGDDWLFGGLLDDWLIGGDGADFAFAAAVDTSNWQGEPATLALDGGNGNYIDGGNGDDTLYGARGSDWLVGGAGKDYLVAGAGGDILDAGQGNELIVEGGAGSDQYIFRRGDGQDSYFDAQEGFAQSTTSDSVSARVAGRTNGTLAKSWAGDGEFTVDGNTKGGEDAISFGEGITMQDLLLERSGTAGAPGMDLIIKIQLADGTWNPTTGDKIVVRNWFDTTRRIEWLRFANGEELRIGDFVSFFKGTGGADVIIGTTGNDFAYGGDGDDKMFLLAGNDFVAGGRGNDLASGNDDNDIVLGGSDDDVVLGGLGNDTVSGDDGNDRIYGGGGNDLVLGGRGDDENVGGAGDDVFRYSRGDGRDIMFDEYAGTWDAVWQNGSYVNGYSVDTHGLISKDGSPIGEIAWDGHWDYNEQAGVKTLKRLIVPGSGAKVVNSGNDTLEFGVGIDPEHLVFQRSGDDLKIGIAKPGTNDQNFDAILDQVLLKEWYLSRNIEGLSFISVGRIGITATTTGTEIVGGTDGNDSLSATNSLRSWWITGGAGDDTIIGSSKADILNGNDGSDTLDGGTGEDILFGGSGDDILEGYDSADTLIGGSGSDTALFTLGSRVYLDEAYRAYRTEEAKGDTYQSIENLTGATGVHFLVGDDGDNVLTGGLGNDTLHGGGGDDTYIFGSTSQGEFITDRLFVVEQVANSDGTLKAGYSASWTTINPGTPASGYYYFRALITSQNGDIVYDSGSGLTSTNYRSTSPSFLAPFTGPEGTWNLLHSTFKSEYWKVSPVSIAGDAGNDTLEIEAGIDISGLTFVRTGDDLEVQRTSTTKAVIKDFYLTSDAKVENLVFSDGFYANLANVRLVGEAATPEDDLMVGNASANTLYGLAGNDVVSGANGNDFLYGGDGDDVLDGGVGSDRLDGGSDSLTLGLAPLVEAYGDTIRYAGSTAAVTISLTAGTASGGYAQGDTIFGAENVTGSHFADNLTGDARGNRLFGLDGNDILSGLGGDDVLVGGAGNDTAYGGAGADNISGGEGTDTLHGDADADLIDGGDGNDSLYGGSGDDNLVGGNGDDSVLDGGDGKDVISGGDGNDGLQGGAGEDILSGGGGNDTLAAGDGNDLVEGGLGDDALQGGVGDDSYIIGTATGSDTIIDADGANRIVLTDVSSEQVWLTRSGDDLKLAFIGGSASVTIAGYFASTGGTVINEIATSTNVLFLQYATGPNYATSLVAAMTDASVSAPASLAEVPESIRAAQDRYWNAPGGAVPVVSDQSYSMSERAEPSSSAALSGNVGAMDPDNNILGPESYSVTTQAQHGTVTLSTTIPGDWTYVPGTYFNGSDSFRIEVVDADGNSAEQLVNVTVTPVNSRPIALSLDGAPPSILERDRPTSDQFMGALDLGILTVDDPDGRAQSALETPLFASVAGYTFSVSDARFEVGTDGHLYLKENAALDFENEGNVTVTIEVTDPGGLTMQVPFNVTFSVTDQEDLLVATTVGQTLNGQESRNGLGGADLIHGYAGDNLVHGLSGNDRIYGGADNDALYGDDGVDQIFGEAGNDQLLGGNGADTLDGGIGNDTLDGGSDGSTDILSGGWGSDLLVGGAGDDTLDGGGDDDILRGGSGADVIEGGLGIDTADYSSSAAGVSVSLATSALNSGGDAAGDQITGIENLSGSAFADTLTGDVADNILQGGAGSDALTGEGGNDTLLGQDGSDILNGITGADRLEGGAGDDQLSGGDGNDLLYGGDGADTLDGGAGDDLIDGGSGSDLLDGGDGNDTYLIWADSGADTISNVRQYDSVDRDVVGYQGGITRENLWFERSNDDLLVSIVGTSTVTRIENWFVEATSAERTNFKIDFFIADAWATRTMNAEGLVTYLAGFSKPTTQAEFNAKLADPTFAATWTNYWSSNEAPTIAEILDQTVNEDGSLNLTIQVADDITPANGITVTVQAVDPANHSAEDLRIVNAPAVGAADGSGYRQLTVNTKPGASGTVDIKVRATDAGGLTSERFFTLNVAAVADTPLVTQLSWQGNTLETGSLPIIIQATLTDTDGSEVIDYITISNVTAGISFNQGTNLGGGVWQFAATQISGSTFTVSGLAINQTPGWSQDLTGAAALAVQARSRESSNGGTASSTSHSLAIVLNGRPTNIVADRSLSFAEDTANGGVAWFSGTDPDGDTLSYSLISGMDAGGRYSLRADGLLSIANSSLINYESQSSHSIGVRVTDSSGLSYDKLFTVGVTDVNEKPTLSSQSFGVNENVGLNYPFGIVSGSDPDQAAAFGAMKYYFLNPQGTAVTSPDGSFMVSSLSPDGRFSIDSATGQVRVASSLNYETISPPLAYTVAVMDTQSTPRVATASLTVSVNNINEAPTISTSVLTVPEYEGPPDSYSIGSLSAIDPDTAPAFVDLRYNIEAGGDASKFSINPTTGEILVQGKLDFEADASLSVTFRVTDSGGLGLSTTKLVAINLTDQNDTPVPTGSGSSNLFRPTTNKIVGFIYHGDPDAADQAAGRITYAVTGVTKTWYDGNAEQMATTLYTVSSDGTVRSHYTSNAPGIQTDTITVTVTDAGGLFDSVDIQVTWNTSDPLPPIVVDLDGDGIELTSVEGSTVRFDMDGDGARDQTGWAGGDDGILVLDRIGDGLIDEASEISFAHHLAGATSDLEGLSVYDSNENGYFDQGDQEFARFQIWQDVNQDGTSQAGELQSLAYWGISAISLEGTPTGEVVEDATDNVLFATTEFFRSNGATGDVGDVFFAYYSSANGGDGDGQMMAPPLKALQGLSYSDSRGMGLDAHQETQTQVQFVGVNPDQPLHDDLKRQEGAARASSGQPDRFSPVGVGGAPTSAAPADEDPAPPSEESALPVQVAPIEQGARSNGRQSSANDNSFTLGVNEIAAQSDDDTGEVSASSVDTRAVSDDIASSETTDTESPINIGSQSRADWDGSSPDPLDKAIAILRNASAGSRDTSGILRASEPGWSFAAGPKLLLDDVKLDRLVQAMSALHSGASVGASATSNLGNVETTILTLAAGS